MRTPAGRSPRTRLATAGRELITGDEGGDVFAALVLDPVPLPSSVDQLDLAPTAVLDELERQAAANRRKPRTVMQIPDALARAGAPAFAVEVGRRIT
jgi:hypothetical protein